MKPIGNILNTIWQFIFPPPPPAISRRKKPRKEPKVDLSFHAIKRAGERIGARFRATRYNHENIEVWLARVATEALQKLKEGETRVLHRNIYFVFDPLALPRPVLLTVVAEKKPVVVKPKGRTKTTKSRIFKAKLAEMRQKEAFDEFYT